MDVPVPGDEPAARPRLDHRFAASGERRVLPAVHPSREDAQRLSGDDHLELKESGIFLPPDFCSLTKGYRPFPVSFWLTGGRWRGRMGHVRRAAEGPHRLARCLSHESYVLVRPLFSCASRPRRGGPAPRGPADWRAPLEVTGFEVIEDARVGE